MKKLSRTIFVACALVLSGCGDSQLPTATHDLRNAGREQVVQLSKFEFIPQSAQRIHFYQTTWLDTHDVFYFRTPRQDADAFSNRLLGFVPEEPAPYVSEWFSSQQDWPVIPRGIGRYGDRREVELGGRREVLIVDRVGYSEVWVMVANWCGDCENADLTGRPPKLDSPIPYEP
jgi:hypothetical protein